jgi:hypothetical protein
MRFPIRGCKTGEFSSDRLGRPVADTLEALDPIGHSLKLIKGRDVLSLQYLPGVEGKAQTRNWPLAKVVESLRHLPHLLTV